MIVSQKGYRAHPPPPLQVPALWHLDLSDNLIRDAGARELATRLAAAPHATMSLRRNHVTAAAAAALATRAPKAAILDGCRADLSDGPGNDTGPDDRSGHLQPVRCRLLCRGQAAQVLSRFARPSRGHCSLKMVPHSASSLGCRRHHQTFLLQSDI